MVLPSGTDAQIPASPVNGMMRYNVDHNEVQVYQSNTWRSLRFKESNGITQQTLGNGDYRETYFGPLNPAPPTVVQSGASWGGQNLLVIVENVIQVHVTNYTIVQQPVNTATTTTDTLASALTIDVGSTDALPTTTVVTGSPYLQSGTTATVTGPTTVSLSLPTVGGTIPTGTSLTFTLGTPSDYYVFFSSPVPLGKPVIVLHGFDQ